jgi:hypothetical protein
VRFIQWFENFLNNELNQRVDGLLLQASLDVLKNEIRTILADKRRQANDLLIQARLLQSQSTDQIFKQKIEQLEQIMNVTEQHVEDRFELLFFGLIERFFMYIRIKKIEVTLKKLRDFEQDFDNTSSWMSTVEANLQRKQNVIEVRIHQELIAVCKRFETRKNKCYGILGNRSRYRKA